MTHHVARFVLTCLMAGAACAGLAQTGEQVGSTALTAGEAACLAGWASQGPQAAASACGMQDRAPAVSLVVNACQVGQGGVVNPFLDGGGQ